MEENKVEKPKVEWHVIKGVHVAMSGQVAIINKLEGMPFEAHGLQMLSGVYTTIEAAKEDADKTFKKIDGRRSAQPNLYVEILRGALAAVEAQVKAAAE